MSIVMTPREIVIELDKHIIGQYEAKRAVAIALRNRWRRMEIAKTDAVMGEEIMPKNILMIGPTGVGKTEIARRLAKLANAPFIKVEATKFTEIGYVGRDVESIIRDLVDAAIKLTREQEMAKVQVRAQEAAEERILNALVPTPRDRFSGEQDAKVDGAAKQKYRQLLLGGELNDKEIEIEVASSPIGVEIMAPPGMEDMTSQLQSMFQSLSSDRMKTKKLKIKDAMKIVREEEAARLVNDDDIKAIAIERVEQNGIVFIDEIDKICQNSERVSGADVSRGGVQRDLLPLVEGCTVSTKYGMVKTDHILFIASGAFHLVKPSDLIPELQGRLPIRVELKALSAKDFERILTEPSASLTEQYTALLNTEAVNLVFKTEGIARLAEIAWQVNENTENIGARRLHTVMERLLEKISFDASDKPGEQVAIDAKYVNDHLGEFVQDRDLSQYIL